MVSTSFACDCDTRPSAKAMLTKAKAKDKPFHGYNPNKHSRKAGCPRAVPLQSARKVQTSSPRHRKATLKPGSKKAKRRKSFCARMSGARGRQAKVENSPKGAALKRWNC